MIYDPVARLDRQKCPSTFKGHIFCGICLFTNLALSASALVTKYLNQVFIVTLKSKTKSPITLSQLPIIQNWLLLITVAALPSFYLLAR